MGRDTQARKKLILTSKSVKNSDNDLPTLPDRKQG